MRILIKCILIYSVIAILFTGCSKEAQGTENSLNKENIEVIGMDNTEDFEEYAFVSQVYEYDGKFDWINTVIALDDKTVLVFANWYYARYYSEILAVNTETGEIKEYSIGLPKERYISNCVKTQEGYVIFSEIYTESKEDDYAVWNGAYLSYFDKDLQLLSEIDITEYCRREKNSENFGFEHMAIDSKGNIYFALQDNIHVISSTGEALVQIAVPAGMIDSMENIGDNVYISYRDKGNATVIVPIDLETEELGEALPNTIKSGVQSEIFAIKDDIIYMTTQDCLYSYQVSTAECKEVVKWVDADVSYLGLHCTMVGEKIIGVNPLLPGFELIVLARIKKSEIPNKTTLVLAMLQENSEVTEQVMKYNRQNREIRIETKVYFEYSLLSYPQGALEEAITRFYLDIVTGEVGDIILVDKRLDFQNLASKGAFAELDMFLDKDSELSKSDLIENIIGTVSVGGKLYGIAPYFSIKSLVGKTTNVGDASSWTVKDVEDMLEEHEDAFLLFGGSRNVDILRMFLYYNLDTYFDTDTNTCYFDGKDFKSLLKLTNELPATYTDEELMESYNILSLSTDKILLKEFENAYGFYVLQHYRALFADDVNIIGYPVDKGSGACVSFNDGLYAISVGSDKKEQAWQYIREMLVKESQMQYIQNDGYGSLKKGFPIRKDVFEQGIAEAMAKELAYRRYYYSGIEYELELLNEEDAEDLKNLVYGIDHNDCIDYTIYQIIMEEASAYFADDKTLDETADIIQKRVQLYIDER